MATTVFLWIFVWVLTWLVVVDFKCLRSIDKYYVSRVWCCVIFKSCTVVQQKKFFFTSTLTPFENFGQILVGTRVCRSFVTFLIAKHATSVNPVIIMWSKKLNRKLARLMTHVLNVCWDIAWITDLCWPPPTDMHKTTFNELTKIATELDSIEVNSSCHISLIKN